MKIKSALITQASGSIGGLTAAHNRGGMYFRARSIPTNPATAFQTAVRNALSQLVDDWVNALTAAQRAAWDLYAELVPILDPLGEPRNIGGIGMYVRSNVPRIQAGLSAVDDAPTTYSLASLTDPTISNLAAATDDVDVGYDNGDDWANATGGALLIYISRPQNPSINFFKGPYRYAGKVLGDDSTPPTSPESVDLPFPVAAGQKVFFKIQATNADGRLSPFFRSAGTAS